MECSCGSSNIGGNRKLKTWSLLVKPTHACNLACQYCYDKPTREMYGDKKMSLDMVGCIARMCADYADNVHWIWHGGEPTIMGVDFYKAAQERIVYPNFTTHFQQSMQTNGTLLNDDWIRLALDYGIEFGVSFDILSQGIRGENTQDMVANNIQKFIKNGVNVGVICVINQHNFKNQIEMYEYSKTELGTSVSFNHIYRTDGSLLNNLELNEDEYMHEFSKFFKYWLHDTSYKSQSERSCMEALTEVLVGSGVTCTTADCRKSWISVNCDGVIYPCDRHVPEKYNMGNINDYDSMHDVYKAENYLRYYTDIQKRMLTHCAKCGYLSYCNGLCNANHIAVTGTGEHIDESSCLAFKKRFIMAYDILRTEDIYDQNSFNPMFISESYRTSFISVMEIKNFLKLKGLFIDWQYTTDTDSFLNSVEYKVFRIFNPCVSNSHSGLQIIREPIYREPFTKEFNLATTYELRQDAMERIFRKNIRNILQLVDRPN